MRRVFLITAIIFFLSIDPLLAAELEVRIVGLSSNAGDVHIAVYNDPKKFPDSDGMLTETHIPIAENQAAMTFKGLKPGQYAVAVYHDANGNHDFDQGIFGLPLEDYGFSNDARVFFAPPSFSDAAFDVSEPGRSITIRLND